MPENPLPLSDEELDRLVGVFSGPHNPNALNLLAFSGARTMPGLLTHLAAAGPAERAILLKAIRRSIPDDKQG